MTATPSPQQSINQLATGALRGDEVPAWRLLCDAWATLERFVRVRLISCRLPERFVEDCGQEVLTRVWRFRKTYRGTTDATFWRWLRQICDNERRRILGRECARNPRVLTVDDPGLADAAPLVSPDESVNAAMLSEALVGLRACLRTLDDGRRRVIELAYFDPPLPERSIAELLGCSPSNVHKLKKEGLRLLQACLAGKGIR